MPGKARAKHKQHGAGPRTVSAAMTPCSGLRQPPAWSARQAHLAQAASFHGHLEQKCLPLGRATSTSMECTPCAWHYQQGSIPNKP